MSDATQLMLAFCGGAGTVTGSRHLLTAGRSKVLIDCGLFQGLKQLRLLNWQPLPFEPSSVANVILTHTHIDHSGYLPRLAREGFHGTIHCTRPSKDLVPVLLRDAAKLQEEDAAYANRKGSASTTLRCRCTTPTMLGELSASSGVPTTERRLV